MPRIGILCPPITAAEAQAAALVLAGASPALAAEFKNFADAIGPETKAHSGDDPAHAIGLQYALGRLFTSTGLAPSVICGIGLGNIAAMSIAGLLAPRDGLAAAREQRAAAAGGDELTKLAGLDLLLVLGHELGSVPASCGGGNPGAAGVGKFELARPARGAPRQPTLLAPTSTGVRSIGRQDMPVQSLDWSCQPTRFSDAASGGRGRNRRRRLLTKLPLTGES